MSNILIDTSAWVDFFRPRGDAHIRDAVSQLIDDNEAVLCGTILAELLRGTRTEREYRDLSDRLSTLHYIETPESTWIKVGHMGSQLARKGVVVPTTDIVIAAVAIDNNLPILHKDRHFPMIEKYFDLRLAPQ